jgi:hypothetical protein
MEVGARGAGSNGLLRVHSLDNVLQNNMAYPFWLWQARDG